MDDKKDFNRKGAPHKEDHDLIHQYIVLTSLIQVLERDLAAMSKSQFKLQKAYNSLIQGAIDKSAIELKEVKKQMRTNGIKVFDRKPVDKEFSSWEYLCRGYTGETKRWSYALRNQTQDKLLSYFNETN